MTAYDASSGVPLEEPRDGRTLGQIVGDISQDLTTLVRQEMDLAKTSCAKRHNRPARASACSPVPP